MPRLEWDKLEERKYKTGVDHAVLYLQEGESYKTGVVWNGITTINETPSGGEQTAQYADNIKYFNMTSTEELGGTIECYYYPDEFKECDGSTEVIPGVTFGQQSRKNFGLSYRTRIGNATKNDAYGYELHLIYGCTASPTERSAATVNDSPTPSTLSYTFTTLPVTVEATDLEGNVLRPTALVVIDSTKTSKELMQKIEDILYGTEDTEARLPLPDEILSILSEG